MTVSVGTEMGDLYRMLKLVLQKLISEGKNERSRSD